MEGELIVVLEDLSIERNKNTRLSKKLQEYGDKIENLCLQLEAYKKKKQILRSYMDDKFEACNKHEEETKKVVSDLKL